MLINGGCPIIGQFLSSASYSFRFHCSLWIMHLDLRPDYDTTNSKEMEAVSLKLIFRSWQRNKTFAVISILSLAIGIACTNLLVAYVIYAYNVEGDNPKKERIYYMAQDSPMTTGERISYVVGNIPPQLKEQYATVEDYLRLNMEDITYTLLDHVRQEPILIVTADRSFPRFFPYDVLEGDLNEALTKPDLLALSESCARKLFGETNVVGKPVTVGTQREVLGPQQNAQSGTRTYQVAAVLKDRMHPFVKFDALTRNPDDFHGGTTLLLTNRPLDTHAFPLQLRKDNVPTLQMEKGQYYFHSLQDSYFQDKIYTQEAIPYINRSQRTLTYVGFISAILILLIACFNYINLSFSRVLQQIRMIHTQKWMGATTIEINRQLFTDTFLTVLIAFLLSLLITHDLLPVFNRIVSSEMPGSFFFSGHVLPVIAVFILLLSMIPAIYVGRKVTGLSQSGYQQFFTGNKKRRIVTALSIAQFVISIGLIFATLTVRDQLNLTEQRGERFRNLIEMGGWTGNIDYKALGKALNDRPQIQEIALSQGSVQFFGLRQLVIQNEDGSETYTSMGQFSGGRDFLKVMRLNILEGLSVDQALERYKNPVYVNKAYAERLLPKGENPVGKPVILYYKDYTRTDQAEETPTLIAGVIDNMYTGTMEKEVYPCITYITDVEAPAPFIQIRLDESHKKETLAYIRQVWEKMNPDTYFTYTDTYAYFMEQNKKTIEFARLLMMYSLISILLTAFGLFGMALYATEQRTKEIGIRKVNGATTWQIMRMLNGQFIGWIIIAFVIAIPVTWLLLNHWLEGFTYRVDIFSGNCLIAGVSALMITLLTVSWHSYKAASRNPVKALRSE